MSIKEYISSKIAPLTISDGVLKDFEIESGLSADEDVTAENVNAVGLSSIGVIEALLFTPRLRSINESGFSETWDYSDLGKYYLYLCRKYGKTPDEEALALMGIAVIKDVSNMW